MKSLMGVFERIKDCGKLTNYYFCMDCKKIIREPQDDNERIINQLQEEAFRSGYNRCIYSFTV
jgi:hypothetical protein